MKLSIDRKLLKNLTNKFRELFKDKKFRKLLFFIIILLIILSPGLYFYIKYQKVVKMLNSQKSQKAVPAETELVMLLKKVNKLIILPENEVPTIATVTDKSKVNNQIFFAKSENGDKALIYTQAKKAFLYRPATDKIIEVMPINIESSTSAKTLVLPISISTSPPTSKTKPSETEKPNPKIAVYNGTKTTGLAKQSEEEINKEISEAEVIVTDNAKGNYKETQIIDITGGNIEIVKKLNSMFSGKVIKSLPDGESDGGADIVILLGGE